VVVYDKQGGTRWAMTERGRKRLQVTPDTLVIGPSSLHWNGTALTITVDEVTVPFPSRLRGTIKVTPRAINESAFVLNPDGRHLWWPLAPLSRVEVDLTHPDLRWSGNGYFDHNRGAAPIVEGFRHWAWSRAPVGTSGGTNPGDGAIVLYEGIRRDESPFLVSARFDSKGHVRQIEAPPPSRLPLSRWRMRRETRSEASHPARLVETLEDTPFYARSVVAARIDGVDVTSVHESLSVDRFAAPVVQMMLAFRMPRRA
jgi:carotenoid 1,2-hydratase